VLNKTEKISIGVAKLLYDKAADYWNEAIRLAPTNYLEAQGYVNVTLKWFNLKFIKNSQWDSKYKF
jgi:hypothetical protein